MVGKTRQYLRRLLNKSFEWAYSKRLFSKEVVTRVFFQQLIEHTGNFSQTYWAGQRIWQNVLDLWTIQETLFEIKPVLLIETGTHEGGSACFYAQLLDIVGRGQVVTIDIEKKRLCAHSRIRFLIGDSVSLSVVEQVREIARELEGPTMVILDSDHSEVHVSKELELYTPFVTVGSYCLVQDGVIDTLGCFSGNGPLRAIENFVTQRSAFMVDEEKCNRFLVSHHPMGWLKRVS